MSFGSKSLPPPTAEQKRRWELMKEKGCVIARLRFGLWDYGEIHHLTLGGRHGAPRLGHDHTILLSPWTHRGVCFERLDQEEMEALYGPSYALTPKAFRAEYGSDEELLRYQNELIGWTKEPIRERKRKSRCTRSTKTVPRPQGGYAP